MSKINVSRDSRKRKGVLQAVIQCDNPKFMIARAKRWAWADTKGVVKMCSDAAAGAALAAVLLASPAYLQAGKDAVWVEHGNAYVNLGLNNGLDREFNLGGTAVGFIGVSSNTTAVTATTVFLNGASGGAAANTIIKAISPAAARTAQTVTGGATFVNADFTAGVFIWNKIGFVLTSTDAGTGLVDVIGGTGGTSPYNKTFVLDLTGAGSFTVTAQIAVTASAI